MKSKFSLILVIICFTPISTVSNNSSNPVHFSRGGLGYKNRLSYQGWGSHLNKSFNFIRIYIHAYTESSKTIPSIKATSLLVTEENNNKFVSNRTFETLVKYEVILNSTNSFYLLIKQVYIPEGLITWFFIPKLINQSDLGDTLLQIDHEIYVADNLSDFDSLPDPSKKQTLNSFVNIGTITAAAVVIALSRWTKKKKKN